MKKIIPILLLTMVAGFCSCSKDTDDEEEITPKKEKVIPALSAEYITLKVGETKTITCNVEDVTWKSDNILIASVDNGVVRGEHVGDTYVRVGILECKVKVTTDNNTFTEPYKYFGASREEIENKMTSYTARSKGNLGNDRYAISYYGKGKVLVYAYIFKSDKLESCAFTVEPKDCVDLVNFLNERYVLCETKQTGAYTYEYGFMAPDKSFGLECDISASSGGLVTYIPSKDN